MRILSAAVLLVPLSALAIVPAPAPTPVGTVVPINTGAGFQYDPHVSGDVAAYTDQSAPDVSAIRYYRFSTNTDAPLPPAPGTVDSLSDVSGSRIAFTRVSASGAGVFIFDTATLAAPIEIDPQPGANRVGVALGNSTVAYVDFVFDGTNLIGTIVLRDVSTNTNFVATLPGSSSQNPSVAASGDVVVFERCVATNVSDCDIQKAVRSGGAWSTSAVTSTPAVAELNPDTDGTSIVFESNRAGTPAGNDIYVVPVAGGAEQRLELPGDQFNPSIASGVIAFESNLATQRDIYVYLLASNQLIQITNTPDRDEFLNDVTVLANGDVRLVWSVNKALPANDSGDIYGLTFTPPSPPPPPPPVCQNRTVTLDASKLYNPSRFFDATATLNPDFSFALPAEIPVTVGNSGNHWITLTITKPGGAQVSVRYKGGSSQAHPVGAYQLSKATKYVFDSCSNAGLHPGSVVTAAALRLHLDNGDSDVPAGTAVRAILAEVCLPPPGHCHHHGGGQHQHGDGDDDDDDDDVTASAQQSLQASGPEAAAPRAGCSASGGGQLGVILALVAFCFALPRPARAAVRARARRNG